MCPWTHDNAIKLHVKSTALLILVRVNRVPFEFPHVCAGMSQIPVPSVLAVCVSLSLCMCNTAALLSILAGWAVADPRLAAIFGAVMGRGLDQIIHTSSSTMSRLYTQYQHANPFTRCHYRDTHSIPRGIV
jgi:hypothetical protein